MTAGHEREHLALLRELDELLLQLREWQGLSVAWTPAS